jgi:hypothetical protein
VENIGPQNLVAILSHVSASAVAQVGPNATTTTVPLIGADLTQADFTGGFAMFDAGALGTNSPPTLAPIASNTATSLTFAAGVLSSAPQAGSNVWLYRPQVFNVQVTAPENVAQWGGAAVEAADATGVVPFRLPYSEAAPGAAAPARAVQVAGSDGTDLRALATTAGGAVLIVKSQGTTATTVANAKALATSATTPILGTAYTVPENGVLNIAVGIESGATATTFLVTRNGTQYLAVNQGNNLTAGAEYDVSIPVAQGDTINFQTGAATTLAVLEVFFTQGQG